MEVVDPGHVLQSYRTQQLIHFMERHRSCSIDHVFLNDPEVTIEHFESVVARDKVAQRVSKACQKEVSKLVASLLSLKCIIGNVVEQGCRKSNLLN